MNTTLASASKQNQNVRIQSPVSRAYWASVTRCVARPDGSGEIVHADGRVERFHAEGRLIRAKRPQEEAWGPEITLKIAA